MYLVTDQPVRASARTNRYATATRAGVTSLLLICVMTFQPGCGKADDGTSRGTEPAVTRAASSGAKCPACLEEEAGHDASGQEHVCRVDAAVAAVPPDLSANDDAGTDGGSAGAVEEGPIQISPDPAILQTIVGARPNLDYEFINQDGNAVNLNDSKGKTLVITSFYTSCPIDEMCPRLTSDMGWLAEQIPDEMRDDIRLIMISFDPAKDSPEVMKAFGRMRGVDYEVTDMLTGDVENIKAMLGEELLVDIEVNPLTNAITTHAMMIQVINPEGYLVVERTANHTESIELVAKEMVRAATMPFVPEQQDPAEAAEPEDGGQGVPEG